ncbi:MAG: hypothetical protein ACK5GN_00905 [Pseudomonadota bacterium]|jgi:hypothetical protein
MTDKVGNDSPGFFRSVFDGAVAGDFSENESIVKKVTQVGVGLLPGVGQVADARDTAAAIDDIRQGRQGAWGNLGFVLAGWLPLVGDLVKSFRKSGVRDTLETIGHAAGAAKAGWREIVSSSDERAGELKGLFYSPKTTMDVKGMESGVHGTTNRFGDIEIRRGLSADEASSVLEHEKVHRFFSPMLRYGQEERANIGLLGYSQSHLLRRVEEGLAEGWARFKTQGLTGFVQGWRFPLENDYGISPERLKVEQHILLGLGTTSLGAGFALSEHYPNGDNTQRTH